MSPKIAIIEPHGDDAYLGLGGLFRKFKQTQFLIVTVTSSDKNRSKTPLLEQIFPNVKVVTLKHPDLLWKEQRDEYREFAGTIDDFYKAQGGDLEAITKELAELTAGYDVLLPCGHRHPMHYLMSKLELPNVVGYYAEYPYWWNRSSWVREKPFKYRDYDSEFNPWTYLMDPKDQDLKWRVFSTIYKEQIRVLWFFKPYYKSVNREMIYVKKGIDFDTSQA